MALGDKKISSVFNTGGGNAKTVSATQEARIRASFEDGTYIQDQGMLENLGPMIYGLQKVEEDIEELRRFVAAELTTYNANDISTWQRVYDRFHVGPQEATPEGIFFKPDGTKMYIVGRSGDDVDEYALSTAWDITTASYTDQLSGLNSSPASESNPTGIYISPDGIYLYITGHSVDQIIQYTMSVAWDVSTATYTREQGLTYNSGSQFTNPDGIDFKSDGTMLFAISRDKDVIQSYNLSTAWDISTISEHQSFSLVNFFDYNNMAKPAGTSDLTSAYDIRISQDGTKIWIVDSAYDAVTQLDLSTPFDVTTSVYSGETSRITPYESLIAGLYVAESVNKAFSISNSNDYVRTFNFGAPTFSTTNKASYSFLTGLGVKGDLKVSQGIINAAGLVNTSSTYLYSTLETHGTSNLGHNNGGRVRLVNNNTYSYDSIIDMMTNLKWGTNTNTQSAQDNLDHSINIGRPHSGTKLNVNIGRTMLSDGAFRYHTGLVNVYSDAQFIDHKGRLKVGQNLQVDGVSFEQLEAYDLGGTIIFNDTFTESSDTNLDSHTPDTGAGWTLAYNTTSRTSQVKGGQGHLRMSGDDSSDGIFYLCDTLPTAQDYEVKVDWSRQDNSNDTLSIIIKYKDANNFLALQWSGSYDYCRLTKIQGGALSNIDPSTTNPFRYGVPTTTTDGQTGSIKLRFIDGKMMVWNIDPEGTISFRGSWDVDSNFHDNDGDGGTFYKFGLGFGEIFSTQGFDATNVWKITNFQVKQLSAASTFNAAQKHYINNGNFGVGTTSPSYKLDVVGKIQTSDRLISNQLQARSTFGMVFKNSSGSDLMFMSNTGSFGVGTTSPSAKLEVSAGGTTSQEIAHFGNSNDVGKIKMQLNSAGAGKQVILDGDNNVDIVLDAQGDSYFNVSHGNVGIGITNPAYILDVHSGTTNVAARFKSGDNQAWISVQDDDSGTYGALFGTDSDAGHHIVLADRSANKRLVIDGSGNVGIGTASPLGLFQLDEYTVASQGNNTSHGVASIFADSGDEALYIGVKDAAYPNRGYGFKTTTSGVNADFTIYEKGLNGDRFTIKTGGNVGIGTTSPSYKLEVVDGGVMFRPNAAGAALTWRESDNGNIAGQLRSYSNRGDIYLYLEGTKTTEITAGNDSFIPKLHVGGTSQASETLEVTGNIAVSGSVQKQISTTHHTININSSTGSTQDFWIPFIEKNEQPTPNITHRTVAPYDGVLKRVIVHSTVAFASNAQIRFHKINNGSAKVFANDNSTDDVTTNVTADMSTAYTSVAFNFTSNNDFRTGDQIGLGIVRNNTAVGDVAITAVWEYELF